MQPVRVCEKENKSLRFWWETIKTFLFVATQAFFFSNIKGDDAVWVTIGFKV